MKDKLRELAERWKADADIAAGEGNMFSGGLIMTKQQCAAELLSIIDAEGDGGAVGRLHQVFAIPECCGWADESDRGRFDDTQKFLAGFGLVIAATTRTHPARSGVVSDEDVEAALKIWNDAPALGRDEDDAYAMRAALEHFAKGERHER